VNSEEPNKYYTNEVITREIFLIELKLREYCERYIFSSAHRVCSKRKLNQKAPVNNSWFLFQSAPHLALEWSWGATRLVRARTTKAQMLLAGKSPVRLLTGPTLSCMSFPLSLPPSCHSLLSYPIKAKNAPQKTELSNWNYSNHKQTKKKQNTWIF